MAVRVLANIPEYARVLASTREYVLVRASAREYVRVRASACEYVRVLPSTFRVHPSACEYVLLLSIRCDYLLACASSYFVLASTYSCLVCVLLERARVNQATPKSHVRNTSTLVAIPPKAALCPDLNQVCWDASVAICVEHHHHHYCRRWYHS